MNMIWRYAEAGRSTVEHVFENETRPTSRCGYFIPWYEFKTWKSDEEGLAKRKECKRCLKLLAGQALPPAPPPYMPAGTPELPRGSLRPSTLPPVAP